MLPVEVELAVGLGLVEGLGPADGADQVAAAKKDLAGSLAQSVAVLVSRAQIIAGAQKIASTRPIVAGGQDQVPGRQELAGDVDHIARMSSQAMAEYVISDGHANAHALTPGEQQAEELTSSLGEAVLFRLCAQTLSPFVASSLRRFVASCGDQM